MAEPQPTPDRVFFKPLPEHDDLQHAYLLAKIAEKVVALPCGCWEWFGSVNGDGYGWFEANRRRVMVHRAVFLLCSGEVVKAAMILHRCDNPPCCNPAHLYLGDATLNNQDCADRGRHRDAKLTPARAEEIRQRAAGQKCKVIRQLAREYGVSPATIGHVLAGRHWVRKRGGGA